MNEQTDKSELSDTELVSGYLKGDDAYFGLLVKKYLNPVYGFILRLIGDRKDSEDVAQEVFVKCWNNLKKFDQEKTFKTWIYSIAKNASIDYLRKKKNINFSEFENEEGESVILENIEDITPLPDELFARKNLEEEMDAALKKIPVIYSTVISLYYIDGFNFREISETLEEPINTVKSRHFRGLKMLKQIFTNE